MKRLFSALMLVGACSLTGLVGCGEKAEEKSTETVTTPGGTTETTKSETVKSTGDAPPANSAGHTAETPK